jgi:hypothetical protein
MAANLVTQIMQTITPEIAARIATALGIPADMVKRALEGGVPAILAALAGAAATPDGTRRIVDAISGLANAAPISALGSANAESAADRGISGLSSLLGGSATSSLADAIGKFSGAGHSTASTLIGLITPLIMNGLRNQAGGLDAGRITNLLLSQKDNIAAALPAGVANALGGSGILSGIRAATATTATQTTRTAVTQLRSQTNWLPWAIAALVLLAAIWWYFASRPSQRAAQPPTTTSETAKPALTVDGVDVGAQVTSAMDNLKTSLQGVTDSASAQTALPKLQEADAQLTKVNDLIAKLSPEQKKALASLVAAALPTLNQLFDKVLALPGVGDIAKPVIDGVKAKLEAMSRL